MTANRDIAYSRMLRQVWEASATHRIRALMFRNLPFCELNRTKHEQKCIGMVVEFLPQERRAG